MPNVLDGLDNGYSLFQDDQGDYYLIGQHTIPLPDHWVWGSNPQQPKTVDMLNWIIRIDTRRRELAADPHVRSANALERIAKAFDATTS